MSAKGIFFAGVAGLAGYALLRAAQAQEPATRAVMVSAPAPSGNRAQKALGWLNVGLSLFDDQGKISGDRLGEAVNTYRPQSGDGEPNALARVWNAVAGGGDSMPFVTNPTTSTGSDIGPGGVDFGAYEARYNLPRGYLRRTAQIESAMNPRAQNPNSSAGGLFQFINATASAYGLRDRFDPHQATDAAARLARDNANRLRSVLGRDPTGAELYLAHQQGGGGASNLLRNRQARAVDVVGGQQVQLNGGGNNMTAGQFADLWINKFNRAV
jgi:hypothetical protein